MSKKSVTLSCPKCDTVVEMEYGIFKKTMQCRNCGNKLDVRRDAVQTVVCANCENNVIYDARKGSGQLCPVCKQPLQSIQEKKKNDNLPCPYCGVINHVPVDADTFACCVCKKSVDARQTRAIEEAKRSGIPFSIKVPDDRNFLIMKHPLDRFPYASRVIVPDGLTALLLRNGVCTAPTMPGSHLLQESLLSIDEQLELAVEDPTQMVTVDVYFVNSTIGKKITWGEPWIEVRSADGKTWGALGLCGTVTVRVVNSRALALFLNYQSGTEEELLWIRPSLDPDFPQKVEASRLMHEIRASSFEGACKAAKKLIEDRAPDLNNMKQYSADIVREARAYVDERLRNIGLETFSFNIDNINFQEDAKSVARRNAIDAEADALRTVLLSAEKMYRWESQALPVHQKGDSALAADVTLDGQFKLRIVDRRDFLANPQVSDWIERKVSAEEIGRSYSDLVRELLKNVFTDTLQPMIDDTDADVNELHRYFGFLRGSVKRYLDRCLMRYGLEVEYFTMNQKLLRRSSTLERYTGFRVHKTEAEIGQQMREFGRRIEERDTEDIARHNAEKHRIANKNRVDMATSDVETAEALDDLALKHERHDAVNAVQRQEMERRDFERKADLEFAKAEKQRQIDDFRNHGLPRSPEDGHNDLKGQQALAASLERLLTRMGEVQEALGQPESSAGQTAATWKTLDELLNNIEDTIRSIRNAMNQTRQQSAQARKLTCPHCGATVSKYDTFCLVCKRYLD